MEEITKVMLNLPKDVNYRLDIHLAKMRRKSVKTTKVELIIKLLQIGLLQESKNIK